MLFQLNVGGNHSRMRHPINFSRPQQIKSLAHIQHVQFLNNEPISKKIDIDGVGILLINDERT